MQYVWGLPLGLVVVLGFAGLAGLGYGVMKAMKRGGAGRGLLVAIISLGLLAPAAVALIDPTQLKETQDISQQTGGQEGPGSLTTGQGVTQTGEVWRPVFSTRIPSTVAGTSRDAVGDFPGSPFNLCNAIEKAGTETANTWGTDSFAQRSTHSFDWRVDIDDDVGRDTAGFEIDDCALFDMGVTLTNPGTALGGGALTGTYFGRVRSISPYTAYNDGNQSGLQVFWWDSVAGWYVGWMKESASQTANGDWISACPAGMQDFILPTTPTPDGCLGWVPLGTTSTTTEEFASFWVVLNKPFGYTRPSNVGDKYVIVIDIGDKDGAYDTYTWSIPMNTRT